MDARIVTRRMRMAAKKNVFAEALLRINDLYHAASKLDPPQMPAMTLGTVDERGRPTVRTMTINKFDERGFLFFTNSTSRTGTHLTNNPYAALCYFCQPLMEQITIEGSVESVDAVEADAQWASRGRDAQFAAWASDQSQSLDDRAELENRLAHYREKFSDCRVPRPPHWLGYRLVPDRVEFWKSGWRHLHERICYERHEDEWTVSLLNP